MNSPSFGTAREVSDHLLDVTGRCLLNGDFHTFSQHFRLPNTVETFKGRQVLETTDDVRRVFDGVRDNQACMGVTDIVRRCVAATFKNDITIEATHETRMLAGNQLVSGPYPAFSMLHFEDGRWKVGNSSYAMNNGPIFDAALNGQHPWIQGASSSR